MKYRLKKIWQKLRKEERESASSRIDQIIAELKNIQVKQEHYYYQSYLESQKILRGVHDTKLLTAKVLSHFDLSSEVADDYSKVEYKVYSQWGDDGIIQYLINKLGIKNKTFVEFGVEDYSEANTRFLLEFDNWSGLIIDGSEENVKKIQSQDYYWRHNLTAVCEFVTKQNINRIIKENGFSGDLGLLHIDIDGNDYWIWDAITCIRPTIVIMEYNSTFGLHPWTIPYKKDFVRNNAHFSNLYFGASITALEHLATKKGYSLICSNSAGNNAYFVRNDMIGDLKKASSSSAYTPSLFRESRSQNNTLSFLSGEQKINQIRGLSVLNVLTNAYETI